MDTAQESRAWPVLAALVAVALLVLGMLVVDVWVAGRVAQRNRELDAFAGRAAHDLRGPLNPIRGYADLLMAAPGSEPPEEIREMASRIRIAVDRMARVVDDMLELSRAGRPPRGEASPA